MIDALMSTIDQCAAHDPSGEITRRLIAGGAAKTILEALRYAMRCRLGLGGSEMAGIRSDHQQYTSIPIIICIASNENLVKTKGSYIVFSLSLIKKMRKCSASFNTHSPLLFTP